MLRHKSPLSACIGALTCAFGSFFTAPAGAQEQTIEVPVGYSELLKPAQPPEAVIIGNPDVADATVLANWGVVLTGREVGRTNLIVVDDAGNEIMSAVLQVAPLDGRPQRLVRVIEGGSDQDGTMYMCGPQPGCAPIEQRDREQLPPPDSGEETPPAAAGEENDADAIEPPITTP